MYLDYVTNALYSLLITFAVFQIRGILIGSFSSPIKARKMIAVSMHRMGIPESNAEIIESLLAINYGALIICYKSCFGVTSS